MEEILKDNKCLEEEEEVLVVIEEEEDLAVIEEEVIVEGSMVIEEEEVVMIATIKVEGKMKENTEEIKEETIVDGMEDHLVGILIHKLIQQINILT
jgi:hypothetical protein